MSEFPYQFDTENLDIDLSVQSSSRLRVSASAEHSAGAGALSVDLDIDGKQHGHLSIPASTAMSSKGLWRCNGSVANLMLVIFVGVSYWCRASIYRP